MGRHGRARSAGVRRLGSYELAFDRISPACRISSFQLFPLIATVRLIERSARRIRRCPAGAHAVAVCASLRLHCGPGACRRQVVRQAQNSPQWTVLCPGALHRPEVAPQNSLSSLRSHRSNSRGESDVDARCARRPQDWPCRPRRSRRTGRSPGENSPPDCSSPGSPSRRHRNRPHRAPPAALNRRWFSSGRTYVTRKGAFGQAAARLWSAEQRRACGPARSADQQLARRGCLNAASKASEVSSAAGPQDRAAQGSRSAAQTAPAKRCGLPGRAFAAPRVVRKSKVA